MAKRYKMVRLTPSQLATKIEFIDNYCKANNAADGSVFDPNSNVTSKNIATMNAELNKDINIQIKRQLVYREIEKLYGKDTADHYIEQLEKHEIYTHDETTIAPYCVAISMYPFLEKGLQDFGGDAKAPQHLSSFNGGFINLIFALSSMFCGAVATVEFLMCFDHFARKDFGDDYLDYYEEIIKQELQQVVYAINQPASARNFQSAFWNISIFDKYYFHALFDNFVFPDGDKPRWDTLNELQKFFMEWFNNERTRALLTFPVVTVSLLTENDTIKDIEYRNFIAKELSKGDSFFIYTSPTVDSLSSCCRLRNDISDQINDFSYSLGAGGVMTGSMNVITLNMNRFVQNCLKEFVNLDDEEAKDYTTHTYLLYKLKEQVKEIHKYQLGFKQLFKKLYDQGMLPVYTANYITLDKQYLTVGINGLVESAEYLEYDIDANEHYMNYLKDILQTIADTNKETCKQNPGLKINTELVPGESLGVKFARWDKEDGYFVPRNCYNSYLYIVEDPNILITEKFNLHGKEVISYCDGGSALHLNLEDYPTEEKARALLDTAVHFGCPYFCINVKVTICNECGYIEKHTLGYCSQCGSKNVDYATRVIGFLKRITNFSAERQLEASERYYH